jgi:hypothetical protein
MTNCLKDSVSGANLTYSPHGQIFPRARLGPVAGSYRIRQHWLTFIACSQLSSKRQIVTMSQLGHSSQSCVPFDVRSYLKAT